MSEWHGRLNRIVAGQQEKPRLVEILKTPDIIRWSTGRVETVWSVDRDFFSISGSLFGGYFCILADQIASHTAVTVMADDEVPRTVQLTTTFFRPVVAGELEIVGTVVNAGKEILTVSVNFNIGEETVAQAQAIISRKKLRIQDANIATR